jgi:hypothetical protein
MNAIESGYSQAELRFFLPLAPGQAVGVLGDSKHLIEALTADGLTVTRISPPADHSLMTGDSGNLPIDLDHLIIPEYSSDCYDPCLSRILQRLKPGGWLLLGIHNSEALYHIFSKKRPVGQFRISLGKSSDLLSRNGLRIMRCYGAYDELEHPEILVPLDTGEAAYFFFRNIFVPAIRFAAWTRPVATLLASIGLQWMLFRGLVIIARRASGGNGDH